MQFLAVQNEPISNSCLVRYVPEMPVIKAWIYSPRPKNSKFKEQDRLRSLFGCLQLVEDKIKAQNLKLHVRNVYYESNETIVNVTVSLNADDVIS